MRVIKDLYFSNRVFQMFGAIAAVIAFGFVFRPLFYIGLTLLIMGVAILLVDIIILFRGNLQVECSRRTPAKMSLGYDNEIVIRLRSRFGQFLKFTVIDELPYQLQRRDFTMSLNLMPDEEKSLEYTVRPVTRGEYQFGKIHTFAETQIGLAVRRISHPAETAIPVYPSLIEMREYELMTFAKISHFHGVKKIRRLGHSYEFEQIKNYVRGDDYRSINWKATGRRSELMVNQYEDERAQQIYSIIDKSRSMRMPFDDLSLLDYSINTSLVISNISLRKHDKSGLLTFSDKLGSVIKAEKHNNQLRKIMDALYREKESQKEASYELLYHAVRNFIKGRSLLFFYTNFESLYALERVLPLLRKINSMHLLVVMFFENREIREFSEHGAENIEEIYHQAIAQKFVSEKRQIVQELNNVGIQAILSKPEELSLNTVNKYLELKARMMI